MLNGNATVYRAFQESASEAANMKDSGFIDISA